MTLVLNGEFEFFPSKLCFILAEKHDFRPRRGGGDNAYLMSLQVPLPDPAGADPKGWGILLAGTS